MSFYSFVNLKNANERIVVKTKWCSGMNGAKVKNGGNRSSTARIIFYSPKWNDAPNFALPIQNNFDATKVACYKGYVLKTFSTYFLVVSVDEFEHKF